MPSSESTHPEDRDRERDREADRGDRANGRGKSAAAAAASKSSKDLSHVPCKFFKVGGCTAGSSCPFSHTLAEPGGQKETCAWFVKGNCKFGHKCALAHILPGQSMAMDRKNKKAAQAAAGGGDRGDRTERGGGREGKGGRGGKRDGHAPTNSAGRNPLLAGGSTAPTRASGRPSMSMPLKATLSPSAPAPPLASFGVLDDLEGTGQLASAPAQGKVATDGAAATTAAAAAPEDEGSITPVKEKEEEPQVDAAEAEPVPNKPKSPSPLPSSAPRPSAPTSATKLDFGPIGSPPTNGIALGTSPHPNGDTSLLSSSPFSAPGAQSVFLSGSYGGGGNGITASLGSVAMMGSRTRTGWGESTFGGMGMSVQPRSSGFDVYESRGGFGLARQREEDTAVDDGDFEDFVPSSLTDLLTPEERRRRMSRSHSGQGAGAGAALTGGAYGAGAEQAPNTSAGVGAQGLGGGHRYSRSVPAPSLLGDIKSIWAESRPSPSAHHTALPSSPPAHTNANIHSHHTNFHTHRGTPSISGSFVPRFDAGSGVGSFSHGEELSMSMGSTGSGVGMRGLSPSNASAAFLPGLHGAYLASRASKAGASQQGLGLGLGGARGGAAARGVSGGSGLAGNYLLGGSGQSPNTSSHIHTHTNVNAGTHHTYRAAPSPFDLTQHSHHLHPHTSRPIPATANNANSAANSNGQNHDDHHTTHLVSPSARILQSHAPGQSLPQGLAAGYSRIHALPPPPSLASPGSAGIGGVGGFGATPPADAVTGTGVPSSGPYGGWKATTGVSATQGQGQTQTAAASPTSGGLDAMFSHLSYSAVAAASRTTPTQQPTAAAGNVAINMSPPGLTRNVSGGRYGAVQGAQGHALGPLSPLSGPVVSRDDDDELFSMDG
ncbi:hypothetical protein DXG03_002317 [Asterophora parasitica]|uniref:C3H1-type domain-containing protein n=1 Tax=Asterophora parasitica TaxID=117018 RepID=A0A9P7KB31_9AGAR|nr:hypothetical protein DXG03_002317 [Asterophora parasitica]